MICPICRQKLKVESMVTDDAATRWFWGRFECPSHGRMRLSGHIQDSRYTVAAHIPECPNGCGYVPVVQVTSTRWNCTSCGKAIRIRNGRLISWPNPIVARMARQLEAL